MRLVRILFAATALSLVTAGPVYTQEKRNGRATAQTPAAERGKGTTESPRNFFYQFSNPEFTVRRITVEHGEDGRGEVTFEISDASAPITESVTVSPAALGRITSALKSLDFLRSSADYQHPKDFSHLGTSVFTYGSEGLSRTVTVNYTENKGMKAVLDEYRKIGQQTMWVFEMTVARDTQPLETPRRIDALDSLLRMGEISDPLQLVPFLRTLSTDERLPLIARNKLTRLIRRVEEEK